jgi:cardiolipin synthase (CMP-forming)
MWSNLPNTLTILRILLVPVTVWCLTTGQFGLALAAFVTAGLTDGVDGYLARRFHLQTELGAYLDPLADKALLVSAFVALAVLQHLPGWLAILVVTRDVLIVGAVLLARYLERPVAIRPVFLSKANTVGQIALVAGVLGSLAFAVTHVMVLQAAILLVAVLTVGSLAVYMVAWLKHMAGTGPENHS